MKRRILYILLAVLLSSVVLVVVLDLTGYKGPEFRIYADMDELSFLDEYTVDQLEDDENALEGLNVVERKCMEVNYKGSRFYVYAYVFLDQADAKEYFDRVGKIMDGLSGWRYRMHQSDRAFFVYGPSRNSRSFKALLY